MKMISRHTAVPGARPRKVMYYFKHEQKQSADPSAVKVAHVFAFVRFGNSVSNRKFENKA